MNKKIFIGIPCYNGMISSITFLGILDCLKYFSKNNIQHKFLLITKESLVSRARNSIVTSFLDDKDFDATHLFFIDSDIGFSSINFKRIFEYDKDIVCAIYPQKGIFWDTKINLNNGLVTQDELLRYNVNFLNRENIEVDNLGFAKVREAATGFMLIKRSVFETMKSKYPELKFKPNPRDENNKSENCYDFFKVGNYKEKDGTVRYLSEDYYFSRLWIDCGGEIFADLTSKLTHLGNYKYTGSVISLLKKN